VPEGDTLQRIARTLGAVLQGHAIERASCTIARIDASPLVGHRIARIEARGKHLLIHFDDGRAIHTHLRMTGSWHLYHPGDPWKKPTFAANLVLETADAVAVCFSAPVVRLLSASELRADPWLSSIGPDIANQEFDAALARHNLRSLDTRPIGEALLTQNALAGIGNVYKSEVLFLRGVDPFALVATYDDATLDSVIAEGARLIQANLAPSTTRPGSFRHGPRTTRIANSGDRLWVYGRAWKDCYACGTRIEMAYQGTLRRSTYHCPTCQPARVAPQR
jgi:endonuclease-8